MACHRSNGSHSRSSQSVSMASRSSQSGFKCGPPTKPPKCKCGTKAVIKTVTKDGVNRGKTFWGCRQFVATGIECGCSFFLWYSEWLATYIDDDDDDDDEAGCLECPEKDVELTMLRRTLITMNEENKSMKRALVATNEENKSMKMKMKFIVYISLFLGGICALLLFNRTKSVGHGAKLSLK